MPLHVRFVDPLEGSIHNGRLILGWLFQFGSEFSGLGKETELASGATYEYRCGHTRHRGQKAKRSLRDGPLRRFQLVCC